MNRHATAPEITPDHQAAASRARLGVIYGVTAYGLWGVFPVYFKAIESVPTLEVLAHRIIWSVVFLLLLIMLRGGMREVRQAVKSRRTLLTLCATTCLIACNWGLFIWAVANDKLLQSALAYFINPLISVMLGFVFLRERLRAWQSFSVALATVAVVFLTISSGALPIIALIMACTFGMYGLLRKTAQVEALAGLTIETGLLAPIALIFLIHEMVQGRAVFAAQSLQFDLLLIAAGVVTAVPLLWFAQAARRLRLATLGFLQYLAPTGHFLLAVLVYGEAFPTTHLIAFIVIWIALLIYSIDTAFSTRPPPAGPPTPAIE
ncbi:MAG: EamA family transporter RarD [Planctomycetota bacterium]